MVLRQADVQVQLKNFDVTFFSSSDFTKKPTIKAKLLWSKYTRSEMDGIHMPPYLVREKSNAFDGSL
jgi:hypothetical protein